MVDGDNNNGHQTGGGDTDNEAFHVPDFIVSTASAFIVGMNASLFAEHEPDRRRGTLLMQGINDSIHGLAAHPRLPQLALSSYSGVVQLWDYSAKRLIMVRRFDAEKLRPQCLTFARDGRKLVVGFTSGIVKVLHAQRLDDLATFRLGKAAITDVLVSPDSALFVALDANLYLGMWRAKQVTFSSDVSDDSDEWVYLGRCRAHSKAITGLEFSRDGDGQPVLVSVSEDRTLAEYCLERSSILDGVVLKQAPTRVEQSAVPTACCWHPDLRGIQEDLVIVANDEYKIKQWNTGNQTCRRTTLGPSYGGPINRLVPVPLREDDQIAAEASGGVAERYCVYSTHEKVVGLLKLPLDGNPHKAMGLIAHPGKISNVDVTFDGSHLLTAGGDDLVVNMWEIHTYQLDLLEARGTPRVEETVEEGIEDTMKEEPLVVAKNQLDEDDLELAPYLALLEGGREGPFYNEIVDYFYLAQLRVQGENSTECREITAQIPLREIPNVMRALGFYPTDEEIQHMVSEVRYSRFTETSRPVENIGLHDFIKLYINHRPVFGVARLLHSGEPMSEEELRSCLAALLATGGNETGNLVLDSQYSALSFADKVLGFDDYENPEGEQTLAMTDSNESMFSQALTAAYSRERALLIRESKIRRALSELAASATDGSITVQSLLEGPPELTTTLPLFQQLVREEQREILRQVGELHLLGDGTVPHNKTHAEIFLQVSAVYGSAHAQFLLGALKASSGDDAGAQVYYQFAAHGGSIGASMAMGYRALHGYGSPKSCEAAMRHYKFAADRVVAHQDDQKLQLYALPDPVRLSDTEGARYHTDVNPAEDIHRAEYLRQRAADLSNADVMVQSASITLFSDLYIETDSEDELEEHAARERETLRFLERSIELGSIKAQALLGHVYAYGLAGCASNVTRAVELYEAALDASQVSPSGEAANGLGVIYSRGIGDIPADPDRARDLFKLAASAGHAEGVFNTGMAFMKMGSYLSSRAKEYFVAAAHVGHLKSIFQLAQIKQRQISSTYIIGTTTNSATCEEVVELYKRVAEYSREGTRLMTIALSYTQRGNWALALELYLIAAEMGYEIAQSNAIWLIDRIQRQVFGSTMNRDAKLAGHLYERLVSRAVTQDSADALVRLGDIAFQDQNYAMALRHYQHADLVSAGNSARALYSVGYMHEHGLGVSIVSTDRALLYYHLAGKIEPSIRLVMALLQFKVNFQSTVDQFFGTLNAAWLAKPQYKEDAGGQVEATTSSETSRGVGGELNNHPRTFQLASNAASTDTNDIPQDLKLGSTTKSGPVEYAAALQFLGDQSQLHLELNRGELPLEHQDFTIETWLLVGEMPSTDNSAEQVVILVDALDNFQLELLPFNGENDDAHWVLRFRKYSLVDENLPELVLKFPNAPLTLHKWNHVAITFDAKYQTVTLILNARVKQVLSFRPHPAVPSRDGDTNSDASSSKFLAVGSSLGRIYGTARHESSIFSGQLVHFRLWKTRKNAREIRVLMMEQYDEVETRDLLIHLRYDVHGVGASTNDESESNLPASPIINGDQPVPGAHGVQLKFVKYPPQDQ
ncbi:hypothetical protein BBO99_00000301 [Phytophthora kernoviae]|uniref:Cilia- and flagella-associated protein 251 n=1 Tax=Phytophthora kernoviae TaxID=325452 RepID=A0A3R7J2T4_9STRA|nr:hypothetical protein JM16_000059 [Phytophthora kernoviae]RLN11122.1 hypothetical protein BBI17_000160 [Phytophthora kernoviae]RLN86073.1 hypothetical protein BBO99_00000301 [Phytophthora kernoviae]